jgi:signal transduction histidine kinase
LSEDPLHVVRADEIVPLVDAHGAPQVEAFLTQPAHQNHIVQFYDDEDFLCDNVAAFLAAGLAAGEPVVVIATEAHRESFAKRIKLRGGDVERALVSGQLTMLDARSSLGLFMVDGAPDWQRFSAAIGGVIARAVEGSHGKRVRAYGEMVDLLWRDGNRQGAIALERLWNDLAERHSFSLLCAYVMGNFYRASDGDPFAEVCAAHTHVIPTETFTRLDDGEARLRAVSELEQRARSLENELVHRRELEAALREALLRETEARMEAERNVRYNEMFAGMLGHDLRNPLGAISMGAHYISRVASGEKATRAATRILSSTERMARMIDQLLDFTRIRVGDGIALSRTRFDLAELCHRVKEEIEAGNPDCAIEVALRGEIIGHWDYDRLLQVFSNLIGNAVHHGQQGSRVSISAEGRELRDVVVRVHNGGAVPAELMPVLFEPFRGGKQPKSRGLGLGLYITRQILLAHGGDITAESDPDRGTTMRVHLPRSVVKP